MNTATSHEQSKRLLACGVDPETADMHWYGAIVPRGGSLTSPPEPSEEWDLFNSPYGFMPEEMQKAKLMEDYYEIIPAWSLGALLTKALPNVFEDGNYRHVLTIQYVHGATEDRVWDMRYEDILTGMFIHDIDAPHPIEACVRMVEKLKEKGRI